MAILEGRTLAGSCHVAVDFFAPLPIGGQLSLDPAREIVGAFSRNGTFPHCPPALLQP